MGDDVTAGGPADEADLDIGELRSQRGELRDAMDDLEVALGAPAPGRVDEWRDGVFEPLARLAEAFEAHVDVNEGPESFHDTILGTVPRLSGLVDRLQREHVTLRRDVAELVEALRAVDDPGGVGEVRRRGTDLLALLTRHRQRGSDLIWEAFNVDVGSGE